MNDIALRLSIFQSEFFLFFSTQHVSTSSRERAYSKCHHQPPHQYVWLKFGAFEVILQPTMAHTWCTLWLSCWEFRRPTLRESSKWAELLPDRLRLIIVVWSIITPHCSCSLDRTTSKNYGRENLLMWDQPKNNLLGKSQVRTGVCKCDQLILMLYWKYILGWGQQLGS